MTAKSRPVDASVFEEDNCSLDLQRKTSVGVG